MNNKVYEVIGVNKNGNVLVYQSGTIQQIQENECITERKHEKIESLLKDMDTFSSYTHYARELRR